MLSIYFLVTGNVNKNMQLKIQDLLKKSKNIYGWCQFKYKKIDIYLEYNKTNNIVSDLQKILLQEQDILISIKTTTPKKYKDFTIIEKNLLNTINETEYLDFLLILANTSNIYLKRIMHHLGNNASYRSILYSVPQFNNLLKVLPSRYIPENLQNKKDFSSPYLSFLPSFSSQITEHTLHRKYFSRHNKYVVEDVINNKINAINFACKHKIPVPKIYQNNINKNDIDFSLSTVVIKPMDGHTSKNVYIIHNNLIHSVEKRKNISLAEMQKEIDNSPYIKWMVEEYIPGYEGKLIPYDIKAFAFYGSIKLLLIIDRNGEKIKHEWLDSDFKKINTGRFNESLFTSNFKDTTIINYASKLSSSIPTPFLRIDFLASENAIYFGEITPRPGHFHEFNTDIDSLLGDSFIEARSKLIGDLLKGKKFEEFYTLLSKKN